MKKKKKKKKKKILDQYIFPMLQIWTVYYILDKSASP